MVATPDLLASFYTLAGELLPHEVPLVSAIPVEQRIAAAARAGFNGMGFTFDDMASSRDRLGDANLRTLLADAGMRWIELEALIDWFADGDRRARSDDQRRTALDQARAIGVWQIKVAGDLAGDWPLDAMAAAFHRLCADAAATGVRVALELLPISNVAGVERARAVVEAAGAANAGLLFDAWHVTRGEVGLAEIAALPPGLCAGVELNDGPVSPSRPDYYDDTIRSRQLPGEGAFDLVGLVAAASEAGFNGPYGVEILSDVQRGLAVDVAAQRAADAARALFSLERADATASIV